MCDAPDTCMYMYIYIYSLRSNLLLIVCSTSRVFTCAWLAQAFRTVMKRFFQSVDNAPMCSPLSAAQGAKCINTIVTGSEKRGHFAQIPNFGFKTLITWKL